MPEVQSQPSRPRWEQPEPMMAEPGEKIVGADVATGNLESARSLGPSAGLSSIRGSVVGYAAGLSVERDKLHHGGPVQAAPNESRPPITPSGVSTYTCLGVRALRTPNVGVDPQG